MADDGLWRIGLFLIVQTILAPEIRYSAFCRYPRTTKKHDMAALLYPLL